MAGRTGRTERPESALAVLTPGQTARSMLRHYKVSERWIYRRDYFFAVTLARLGCGDLLVGLRQCGRRRCRLLGRCLGLRGLVALQVWPIQPEAGFRVELRREILHR